MLEQGHYRGVPVVNIVPPRRGNSMGIASLIMGSLAFLICWVPILNMLGIPLAGLGLLLGLVGVLVAITRRGASIGFPIAGSMICAVSLFVSISMTTAIVGGIKKAAEAATERRNHANATNQVPAGSPDSHEIATAHPGADETGSDKPAASPPSPPPIEWASADVPVKQGDAQIKIVGAKVGAVAITTSMGNDGELKGPHLSISIEITNLSETKRLNYRTWRASELALSNASSLVDNFENKYQPVSVGMMSRIKGASGSDAIYPGKSVADVLVFEEPVEKAEYLNLQLPADHFGGTGMIRIRIPTSMIQR